MKSRPNTPRSSSSSIANSPTNSSTRSSNDNSDNNSNSSNTNTSPPIHPVLVALRPNNSPSKQKLPELDEYQEALNNLISKEEKIYATPAARIEDKLNELSNLSLEFYANSGQSLMMAGSGALQFPLNKTFFNISLEFQKRFISLQNKVKTISHWLEDYALLVEKFKLINEFPQDEQEIANLNQQLADLQADHDKLNKIPETLKTPNELYDRFSLLITQRQQQYIQLFNSQKHDKIKKILANFDLVKSLAAQNATKTNSSTSSTQHIRHSLVASFSATNNNATTLNDNQTNKTKPSNKRARVNTDPEANKKTVLSTFYEEPSQAPYNLTPSQEENTEISSSESSHSESSGSQATQPLSPGSPK